MNPNVDDYLSKARKWQKEMGKLRKILLNCKISEEFKWAKPCYTYNDSNVVIIQGFKEYVALLFFKGVAMKDPKGILTKTGPNTRVGRQIKFTNYKEIVALEPEIKSYIKEAIRVEKSGVKISEKLETKLEFPKELKIHFKKNKKLKTAFETLTPGRQRAYNIYFTSAKQPKTRESRIEKCIPMILKGKGLNDR